MSSAALDERITRAVECAKAAMQQQVDEQARAIRDLEHRLLAQSQTIEKHEKDMAKVQKWSKF